MDAVKSAFAVVARDGFLPESRSRPADFDGPIPIGHGQTNSQPRTVEAMLRLLAVEPGDRVLDVGAGSGWTAALLAELTGPEGLVVGVELEVELARWGESNLRRTSYDWASIRPAASGVLGVPAEGPYSRILVSADATELPQSLVDQLAPGGRLVLPVRSTMTLVERPGPEADPEDPEDHGESGQSHRESGSDVRISTHGSYRFVPLR